MRQIVSTIKKYYRFLIVFCFLSCSLFLLESTKVLSPKEHYPEMLEAAQRAETAFHAVKEEKSARGYLISTIEDPNRTGLIGESYTEITTTLGSLESKRSTTNPNTAAMVADMLVQCGVKPGDTVAVNLSSSFPALNIAVLCALDALNAKGIIINSVGASTYGANLPDFTYLDMEQVLLKQGLISNHSLYFSLGGADDIGREMPEEVKSAVISRLKGYGLEFLFFENLDENVSVRHDLYEKNGYPVCFINAGGNLLSFGGGSEMISARSGIIRPYSGDFSKMEHGLIPMFLNEGIPVIHLLNMKSLLPEYGLPFDPSPVPAAGEGGVYVSWRYHYPLAWGLLAASLLLLHWAAIHHPRRKIPL